MIIRGLICVLAIFVGLTAAAEASPRVDCPLRNARYSVDLPLIELLLTPEAAALVEQHAPGAMAKIPARWMRTEPPSFAAIITLRGMGRRMETSAETMDAIDAGLRALSITAADRTRRCAR